MTAKTHLSALHDLPCVVCRLLFGKLTYPVVVHHLESVRDEMSHYAAIPICDPCHKLLHHESRRGFERRTKLTDIDLLAGTIMLMERT